MIVVVQGFGWLVVILRLFGLSLWPWGVWYIVAWRIVKMVGGICCRRVVLIVVVILAL